MQISVQSTAEAFARQLSDIEKRQMPFAIVVATTRAAKAAQGELVAEMRRVFDRPVPFTLNSLRVEPATRADPTAAVWFRDFAAKGTPAGKYLQPQVHGGGRRNTRFEGALRAAGLLGPAEFLVPAKGAPLDGHGNLSRGLYSKILSQLRASRDSGQNETVRSRRRRRRRGGSDYFMPRPGSRLPRGIYERRGRMIRAVMIVVRQPMYRARFDFFGVGMRAAREAFPFALSQALDEAVRRSNYRGDWR